MSHTIHSQARTTPMIRKEIRESEFSQAELAEKYGVTRQTIRKWQNRGSVEDRSHRPNKLYTTLSPLEEEIAVSLRKTLLLPLDDLLAVVREFINSEVSRSGLDRCLRRHKVSRLQDLIPQVEGCKKSRGQVLQSRIPPYLPYIYHGKEDFAVFRYATAHTAHPVQYGCSLVTLTGPWESKGSESLISSTF